MAPRKGRDLTDDRQFAGVVEQLSGGYKTVGQMVYSVLKEAILSGAFAPGEWLRQESLAEAIGVSRIPVRTALLQLESEGLILFNPHRGARVRTLTVEQIDEIYRLRTLLETFALREAAKDLTSERLDTLRTLARQLDTQSGGGEFVDVRIQFYRQLYDADRNPLLVQMIEELRSHVGRYLLSIRFEAHAHEHVALVRFIERGDEASAERWLTTHLEQIRLGIRELIAEDAESEQAAGASPNGRKPTTAKRATKGAARPRKAAATRATKATKATKRRAG